MARTVATNRLAVRNYPASVFLLGVGNYINIPYVADMQIGAGSFFRAMWFNAESNRSATAQGTIYQSNGTGSWLNGVMFYANNKALGIYILGNLAGGIGSSITGLFNQFGNGWHRLVVVFDSSDWKARVYVDGALFYTTGAFTAWNVTAVTDSRFGYANLTNNALFQYSDIVLGRGVPTLADIQADYYNNKQLPSADHRYLLTEGTGTTVADSIGGNTGAVNVSAGVWQTASPMKSRTAVAQNQNLLIYSDPSALGQIGAYGNITVAAYAWSNGLLSNATTFGDNSLLRYSYKQGTLSTRDQYTLSVYVIMDDLSLPVVNSSGGLSDFQLVFNTVAVTSSVVTSMGNNIYRISYTAVGSGVFANYGVIKNVTNSSKGFKISGYQLVKANWAGPLVLTTATAVDTGNIRNIVAQKQNILVNSQNFAGTGWNGVGSPSVSITANAGIAPDGTNTMTNVVPYALGGNKWLYQSLPNIVFTATTPIVTVSIYAKANGYNWLGVGFGSGAAVDGAYFNLASGVVGTVTAGRIAKITLIGDGIYRCTVTGVGTLGAGYALYQAVPADGTALSYTGDGTSGVLMWGAQANIGNWSSPYIATTSAAYNIGNIRKTA